MKSNKRGDGGDSVHDHQPSGQRRSACTAIQHCSPIWFTICMDTGILSIITHLLPYQFNGLGVLSTILFVFNLFLFSLFTLISIARLIMFPTNTKSEATNSADEISYLAAPAIAYLTIVSQVGLTCSPAWGHGLTILAYVLWRIGMVWTILLCSAAILVLAKRKVTDDRSLSPAIFLPTISVMTSGTTGGLLVNYSYKISARLALPVIIVSYMCIGYALFLSILLYAIYLHRLIAVGPPQPTKIPSLVITVGPLGQFATAIQLLGTAAYTRADFADYDRGAFLKASAASAVASSGVLVALLILGFALFWIATAWYILIEALLMRKLSFSLTWWSMIFPMGSLLGVSQHVKKEKADSGENNV
ncbi:C4-dicarboxylate transporter/malic acid transport protein, partial [Aureobasidium melanogenum]|uniref:C4-dicarboxylate transporter/malic acid transport protein n=1 Tax=Aureobasidium melanogenum (strain CBS 110374) TaxID=1043003 RepID=A0A074VA25_AURM1